MTVKELRELIKDFPDDMPVVYNYDTGHSFPELRYAYRMATETVRFDDRGVETRRFMIRTLVLDENPPKGDRFVSITEKR